MTATKWIVTVFLVGCSVCTIGTAQIQDRGLVGLRRSDKSIYLGWRLLTSDSDDTAFHIYRQIADSVAQRITSVPVHESTNFIDKSAPQRGEVRYFVKPIIGDQEGLPSSAVTIANAKPGESFVRIPLRGETTAQKVAIGDLTGDGRYDYIIKQPNFSTDPWEVLWKKSPDTYKIEAYRSDGQFLWQYDMGWAIEMGIWYSPYIVYDLDGDGRAEVYVKGGEGDPRDPDGRVTSGPEWVMQLDGRTGKVLRKAPCPDRTGYPQYNLGYSRNLMGVAYIDGKNPHLIIVRGTYNLIKVVAYNAQLEPVWEWNSQNEKERYDGSGAHTFHAADVDGDGCDEIILGSSVVDNTGRGLWTNPMHNAVVAHPDVCYVGNIDPSRPGLEIFYGFETSQPRDGVCLVDAATGRILWSYDGPTVHLHGQDMVADISADHPGQECYAAEQNGSQAFLYTADGTRICNEPIGGLSPRPVYWDADPQKEIIVSGRGADAKNQLIKYKGQTYQHIEGRVLMIADCLGDWREEIITSLPGELRIYTTTLPARTRRDGLMQDRLYRLGVTAASMGYFYPPQHSGGMYR